MKDDFSSRGSGSRYNERTKRRKTNKVLNSLIAIVIVLIIIVSAIIFGDWGNSTENPEDKTDPSTEVSSTKDPESEPEDENNPGTNQGKDEMNPEQPSDVPEEPAENNKPNSDNSDPSKVDTTEGGSDKNVKRTIINNNWKPVGTEQTGVHETVFQTESLDWQEMLKALSYATDIPEDNLQTWFIRNGGYNKAIGTVTAKNEDQAYRVYIEWVDEEGWKPTKVEELIENDKGMPKVDPEEDDRISED